MFFITMSRTIRQVLALVLALPVFLSCSFSSSVHSAGISTEDEASNHLRRGLKSQHPTKKFKNVIMLIPDGCDDSVLALARWYKKENLQVDELARGSHHPYMSNSVIVDSAPGGTAFSTGQLTTDKFIAVGPRREDLLSHLKPWDLWPAYAPIATVLEGAKHLGMGTGLVSTSRVTHATPASFASHVDNRSKENEIALHMAMNGVDVVMGGGGDRLLPHSSCPNAISGRSGSRNDCLNLEDELISRGYELCYNAHDMHSLHATPGKKVWCALASGHMEPDIDRQHFAQDQPSLAEMTEKALEVLSNNENGFFLMVEGSQVDWAGHANDPIWMATDFIAWDNAVKVAVDFAKHDGDTLVLALPDHNTGGLKIGNYKHEYVDREVEFVQDPMYNMKMTSQGVIRKIGVSPNDITTEQLKNSVSENWGISLTDDEASHILEYSGIYSNEYLSNPGSAIPLNYALARVVSEEYTAAAWSTHGHNGEHIPMWIYGMEPPKGIMKNTDIGALVADVLGVDIIHLSRSLYVDLDTTHLSYSVDTTDITSPHALVEGYVFPLGFDFFLVGGERHMVPGITVYAPSTGKLYISSVAIKLIESLIERT